ncbi:Hypothetical protein BCETI_1000031 [Brucella ceti str. Cudo]|uniref:Uncharacterized protein n=1 Tax=Brucella ceti str. Cudo TaxID=595497 RepID=C0G371_9HYPH|nr:Hypothetical protein BCETI_1000031 [Brucella ceti str. Cudo]
MERSKAVKTQQKNRLPLWIQPESELVFGVYLCRKCALNAEMRLNHNFATIF